jgi:hypothetical protein
MKATVLTLALACLALSGFSQARVDLTAVITKDFVDSPTFDQAAQALKNERPLVGFGWEVLLGHLGLGGSYAVDFHQDGPSQWWLDWQGQGIFASYHLLGSRSFVDPFVDAGIGCAGRIYLGPQGNPGSSLALTLYPFVSAGAALELQGLRLGAKLSYDMGQSAIPVTEIPATPLGRFQLSAFAGFSMGGR